ncbi:MAG: hypothetical protein ABJK59_04870 [Erythrobacter sp.]|uniref:hypothetical protein n=1 Tax=Erythrobacter sp. TaxID=1042 RepID=UPI003296C4E6
MISKIGTSFLIFMSALLNPVMGKSEGNSFRVEVPYADFFPECRENYEDAPCEWSFLVISRPPLNDPTGSINYDKYELRLPTLKWNGLNYRSNNELYPNCSMEIASSLVKNISEQRQNQNPRWIASLPTELSGCFSPRIVKSEVGTDEYWVINNNTLVASISCAPHGSVLNPTCSIEIYLGDGSAAVVGGNFPYANIENFLLRFSRVMIDLSDAVPVSEYQRELRIIFEKRYEVTPIAMDVIQRKKSEIDE